MAEPLLIVIISGATGRTAQEVVNSALAQFRDADVRVVRETDIRSSAAASRVVRNLSSEHAVILHSLVSPKVRDTVLREAKRRMIPTVDVLGPVIAVLADQLGRAPLGKPGLSYERQKDYIDRIDAVSFTLDHDDGARLATLHEADVVLVGVSRASKSVTCFYLAYRGIRAANVPLIKDHAAPEELVKLPKEKVIGLTITPARLQSVREARRYRLGGDALDYYVHHDEINEELRHAQRLMGRYGWRSIDVSYMGVEEVAVQVLQMVGLA
jgi:regulator of PEP synthase PpsR (kinase-PPPase family)